MAKADVIEYTDYFTGGDSTSIEQVWYNENTHRMTVAFQTSGLYSYDNVSPGLFREFQYADSLGQFFRDHFRRPGYPMPGAKHDERRAVFTKVDKEPDIPEVDFDALKAVRLTTGKGPVYTIRFALESAGTMQVRAEGPAEAIEEFEEYMRGRHLSATVLEVSADITKR